MMMMSGQKYHVAFGVFIVEALQGKRLHIFTYSHELINGT